MNKDAREPRTAAPCGPSPRPAGCAHVPSRPAVATPVRPRLQPVRTPAEWWRERSNVFELVPDPASDIVRGDYLVDRLRSLSALGRTHLQRPVDRFRGYLDTKGIDPEPVRPRPLMCPAYPRTPHPPNTLSHHT